MSGPVEEAVAADVAGRGTASLREAALALARAMDQTTSARDVASLARELRATLDDIGLVRDEQEPDLVDELAARRDTKGPVRPASGEV